MDPQRLQIILQEHALWLEDADGGARADLALADLRGVTLAGADLRRANLTGANLSNAVLAGAKLSHASLFAASLRNADLTGADLSRADLRGAGLNGAVLSHANLEGVDMRGDLLLPTDSQSAVGVMGSNLHRCNLDDAVLRFANLSKARLTEASACGADLRGARLSGAALTATSVKGADFRGADLANAILCTANFSDCELEGAVLNGAIVDGADFSNASLVDADLRGVNVATMRINRPLRTASMEPGVVRVPPRRLRARGADGAEATRALGRLSAMTNGQAQSAARDLFDV